MEEEEHNSILDVQFPPILPTTTTTIPNQQDESLLIPPPSETNQPQQHKNHDQEQKQVFGSPIHPDHSDTIIDTLFDNATNFPPTADDAAKPQTDNNNNLTVSTTQPDANIVALVRESEVVEETKPNSQTLVQENASSGGGGGSSLIEGLLHIHRSQDNQLEEEEEMANQTSLNSSHVASKDPENVYVVSKVPENALVASKDPENVYVVSKDPENVYVVSKDPENVYVVSKDPENVDTIKNVIIDTAAPIESVKAAVSKFGGIVDWKAHKVQTVERRKVIEHELDKAQEEIPMYKLQYKAAEGAKTQVMKELESTKRLIEELKLNLEKAQMEEQQAKQDSELAKLRVVEMEQGVTDEASVAAKAQLEVARARHSTAVSELKTVKDELEQLHKDFSLLDTEKDSAVKKAEEAVSTAKELEKSVEDFMIELITTKESLESAQAAHMEAEDHRIGTTMTTEQDTLHWEKELKQAEEELEKVNQKMNSAKELQAKLDTASSLLVTLKSELVTYMESKPEVTDPKNRTHTEIHEAIALAKRELGEVKQTILKSTTEVNILKLAAESLNSELETAKSSLAAVNQREGMASVAVSSLESELTRIKMEINLVQSKEKDAREKMVDLPKTLQEAAKEADDAKLLAEQAREEMRKAKDESDQTKASAGTIESRLHATLKEIDAARASEKLAMGAINALKESESAQKDGEGDDLTNRVTLSLEEYYALSKRAHEAEEEASARVLTALSEIEIAKDSEKTMLMKLEEASLEMKSQKEALEIALVKAEKAKEGKLGVEQELRKWRSEHEKRRKGFESGEEGSGNNKNKELTQIGNSSTLGQNMDGYDDQESQYEDSSSDMKSSKKKKKSFFPRFFMFLARKKPSQKT